ncbi:MAG: hypothetical protein Q4G40_09455 [Brachybacterium sp.]|nr:hypothetical protein [Brachybacterium sp.]
MSSKSPAQGDSRLVGTSFRPSKQTVVSTIVIGLIFLVVLEFLVLVSFIGQRLWNDERLYSDLVFIVPALLWLGVLAATAIFVSRVLTARLDVDRDGFRLRGLFRRTQQMDWSNAEEVWLIQDISARPAPAEERGGHGSAWEGMYVVGEDSGTVHRISSRLFGAAGQKAVLSHAERAGATVERIDRLTPKELAERLPGGHSWPDGHPNLLLIPVVLFYLGHNVLTFVLWGL